jgi:hypothetical protein
MLDNMICYPTKEQQTWKANVLYYDLSFLLPSTQKGAYEDKIQSI